MDKSRLGELHDVTLAEIEDWVDEVHCAAARAKENAGYGGFHHDGGAREMIDSAETFQAGVHFGMKLSTKLPDGCYEYIKKKRAEEDPEYKKYLELKEKFES